ncbi:MAG: hypothetical protein ABIF71_00205 [Planctomycetota bacterium]
MICKECRGHIPFLDEGGPAPDVERAVREHLAACPACAAHRQAVAAAVRGLHVLGGEQAPAAVKTRVLAAVKTRVAEAPVPRPAAAWHRRSILVRVAAVLVIAGLAAVFFSVELGEPSRRAAPAADVARPAVSRPDASAVSEAELAKDGSGSRSEGVFGKTDDGSEAMPPPAPAGAPRPLIAVAERSVKDGNSLGGAVAGVAGEYPKAKGEAAAVEAQQAEAETGRLLALAQDARSDKASEMKKAQVGQDKEMRARRAVTLRDDQAAEGGDTAALDRVTQAAGERITLQLRGPAGRRVREYLAGLPATPASAVEAGRKRGGDDREKVAAAAPPPASVAAAPTAQEALAEQQVLQAAADQPGARPAVYRLTADEYRALVALFDAGAASPAPAEPPAEPQTDAGQAEGFATLSNEPADENFDAFFTIEIEIVPGPTPPSTPPPPAK